MSSVETTISWIIFIGIAALPFYFFIKAFLAGNNQHRINNRNNRNNRTRVLRESRVKKNLVGNYWKGWVLVLVYETLWNDDGQIVALFQKILSSTRKYGLFVLCKVDSDEEAERKRKKLISCGLEMDQILFCSTERGKIAIARQLQCNIYIDKYQPENEIQVKACEDFAKLPPSAKPPQVGLLHDQAIHRSVSKQVHVNENVEILFATCSQHA